MKPVKGGFQASVTITNTGKVAGREVVQLYVAAPKGKLEKPESELKAFAKTRELKPGESQTLTMTVNDYDLASYDESKQAWQTDAGTYQVRFASDVETTRATAAYKLSKSLTQQCNDVLKPKQIKN